MPRAECARLEVQYKQLNQAYILAFGAMLTATALSSSDFSQVQTATNEARINSEMAKLELDKHRYTHVQGDLPPDNHARAFFI
jgi:hypothetical protein